MHTTDVSQATVVRSCVNLRHASPELIVFNPEGAVDGGVEEVGGGAVGLERREGKGSRRSCVQET